MSPVAWLLAKFLNVPQQFITQVLNEYQEFENQKIAQLQDEILNLQNEIYENELKIKSLEIFSWLGKYCICEPISCPLRSKVLRSILPEPSDIIT